MEVSIKGLVEEEYGLDIVCFFEFFDMFFVCVDILKSFELVGENYGGSMVFVFYLI